MQNSKPRIVITMGDPAGIGPEICAKLLQTENLNRFSATPIILGDASIVNFYCDQYRISCFDNIVPFNSDIQPTDFDRPTFIDFSNFPNGQIGVVSAQAGSAAFQYIDTAIKWHQNDHVDAVVTGPINKLSLHAAGFHYPGHTEIFAEKTATDDYCMMQYSDELTCAFATTHIGYAQVLQSLTVDRITDVIRLTYDALLAINGQAPKLVVCGLNPHAGENGLFGNREEEDIIEPAIARSRAKGIEIEGPLPPDTCFIPSRRATADAFICMYHDQGHIPLKALVFDKAVNVTLGLPIIRTSVDHGTAFDIVGQDLADPSSLFAAIELAERLAIKRLASRDLAPIDDLA